MTEERVNWRAELSGPVQKGGRPLHAGWTGFIREFDASKNKHVAICSCCGEICANISMDRLAKHRERCQLPSFSSTSTDETRANSDRPPIPKRRRTMESFVVTSMGAGNKSNATVAAEILSTLREMQSDIAEIKRAVFAKPNVGLPIKKWDPEMAQAFTEIIRLDLNLAKLSAENRRLLIRKYYSEEVVGSAREQVRECPLNEYLYEEWSEFYPERDAFNDFLYSELYKIVENKRRSLNNQKVKVEREESPTGEMGTENEEEETNDASVRTEPVEAAPIAVDPTWIKVENDEAEYP